MNLRLSLVLAIVLVAIGSTAHAADYSLHEGAVRFSAPDDWSVMIKKTSGNPQLYAFQVPNPHARDTLTRVTVSTHEVANRADFLALVSTEADKAGNLPSYNNKAPRDADLSSLRYSADQDGEALDYRENFYFKPTLAVQLRCVSPQDNPAPASWKRAYHQACDAIGKQLAN